MTYTTTDDVQLLISTRGDRITKVCKTPEGLLHHFHSTHMFTDADLDGWTPIESSTYVGLNPDFPVYPITITTMSVSFSLSADFPIFPILENVGACESTPDYMFQPFRGLRGQGGGVSGYCDRLKTQLYEQGIDVVFDRAEVDRAQIMFLDYVSARVAA